MFRSLIIVALLFVCCAGCRQPAGGIAQRQSLFGQPQFNPGQAGQGGFFNQASNTSLFGQSNQAANSGGFFGRSSQPNTGGGFFSRSSQPNSGGGFFSRSSQPTSGGGGFFGRSNNQTASSGGFFSRFRRNPTQIQTNTPEEFQEYSQLAGEIDGLNQQVGAFDSDNQQLYTEIAGLKQKLQVAADYNNQIKQQLADNSTQFQQLQLEKQNAEQQLAQTLQQQQQQQLGQQQGQQQGYANANFNNGSQSRDQFASTSGGAPTQLLGSATVRANNSLLQKVSGIQIPGGQARLDGDVIRVEFPTDVLFTPGTYEIRPEQTTTVRNIVSTIRQQFPQNIIGIESHWDGTPLNSPTITHHQLTATQSLAMFNRMVQFGLPADQLFTMAMGSNRPRHPQSAQNGISPNRRVEIVIYPELYNSN